MHFFNSDDGDDSSPKEALLELIELEEGRLVLRDVNKKEDPLVSIDFSNKVKDMLGDDIQMVGQQMIQAAIQTIMNRQMKTWHANVYDEKPENYS